MGAAGPRPMIASVLRGGGGRGPLVRWRLLDGCCWSSADDWLSSLGGGEVWPLWCGCGVGSLHGGGFNGHRGPVMETTLIVRRTRGDSDLHGGGREGVVRKSDDMFHSDMFVFGGQRDGCRRPRRQLSPILFEV
jgi:hypothetical protein